MNNRVQEAVDFALTNGILKYNSRFNLTHAPVCLSPFGIEKNTLDYLTETTPIFNEMMIKVGEDRDFLQEQLGPAARTDEFIKRLMDLFSRAELLHHLQISRNDFLMTDSGNSEGIMPKQVEFNTISNSFVFLSSQVYLLHRHMASQFACDGRLVVNNTLDEVVDAMAEVIDYYGYPGARLLMVVQEKEQNIFDQRGIEYRLLEKYGIQTLRLTLEEVAERGKIKEGHLAIDNTMIALTYFRAGYSPGDYPDEQAWKGRELIENSTTVRCPSVGMQLAGAKKIQQSLVKPGNLERYLTGEQATKIRRSFVGLYDLEENTGEMQAWELPQKSPGDFVLKPQREGGGNNYYDDEMVSIIRSLNPDQMKAYILMERIKTPVESSILVVDQMAEETGTVSEIGRYAVCFRDMSSIRFNRDVGYLVRTKAADQNEGGVCAGYACLNSLCLNEE
jgi:glutathione synthase